MGGSGWSHDHTNMVLIGIAVASEVIASTPLKSNSIVQLLINLAKSLVGIRGNKK